MITGGTVTAKDFGGEFSGSLGDITLRGGTINVNRIHFEPVDFSLTLSGTTPGSITAANGFGDTNNVDIRWDSGSMMTITMTGATDWAENNWNSGTMTFDGQDFTTLGDWSAVDGVVFNYDGGTQTLSLVPEPSQFALTLNSAVGPAYLS